MSRLKLFQFLALAMFVLNVVLIGFIFWKMPGPGHGPRGLEKRQPATVIMHLDKEQNDLFLEDAKAHAKLIKSYDQEQKQLLLTYFQTIIDSSDSLLLDSLLAQVQDIEKKKIESTYKHFQTVESIIRPDQRAGFEDFVSRAIGRIIIGDKKKPIKAKDF